MTDKQTIIKNLINGDVRCCASVMVSDLISEGSHWAESLTDCLMGQSDYSEPPEDYRIREAESGGFYWARIGDDMDDTDDCDTEQEAIQAAWEDSSEEPEYEEVFEHWIVSDRLADELEEIGAPVARDVLGFNIWGRCETGQSLTMDHHLSLVADLISKRVSEITGR